MSKKTDIRYVIALPSGGGLKYHTHALASAKVEDAKLYESATAADTELRGFNFLWAERAVVLPVRMTTEEVTTTTVTIERIA